MKDPSSIRSSKTLGWSRSPEANLAYRGGARTVLFVLALAAVAMHGSVARAACPGMGCKHRDPMPIKVWLNPSNCSGCATCAGCSVTDCWNYDTDELARAVVFAINTWNSAGGSALEFRWMGVDSFKDTALQSEIIVQCTIQDDGTQCLQPISMSYNCGCEINCPYPELGGRILIQTFRKPCNPTVVRWDLGWSFGTSLLDWASIPAVLVHEFGHVGGMHDADVTEPPTCDTVMLPSYVGLMNTPWLWPEDIRDLQTHASFGYGARTYQVMACLST